MLLEKAYYLEPEKAAAKPYALLREALRTPTGWRSSRSRSGTARQLAMLRVRDDVIVMQTMLWPDEVRKPDFGFLDDDDRASARRSWRWPSSLVDSHGRRLRAGRVQRRLRAASRRS